MLAETVGIKGVFAPNGRRLASAPAGATSGGPAGWADPFLDLTWAEGRADFQVARLGDDLVGWDGYVYRYPEGLRLRPLDLLEGYRAEGVEFFRRLGGSFVIFIYDGRRCQLTLASDRLASRPLFYARCPGELVFSTHIRAVLAHPGVSRQWDQRSVVEFLRFTMILGERTLYRDISLLPPASVMTVTPEGGRIEPYWDFRFDERWDLSVEEYAEGLAERFVPSVRRLMPEDGTVGLMLSGGLDSRMIAAALLRLGMPLTAVTFGGFENDEVRLARRVARVAGLPFQFLGRTPEYYLPLLQHAVRLSNGLYAFYHAHMLDQGPALRASGLDTLIHGWGLDLLFSGSYLPRRRVRHFPGRSFLLLRLQTLRNEEDIVQSLLQRLSLPTDSLVARLPTRPWQPAFQDWPRQAVSEWVNLSGEYARSPYNRYDWVLVRQFSKFRSFLYPLSVRWLVRERCPLYDPDLLEWYLRMPPHLRFASRAYGRALAHLHPALARLPYSRLGCSILAPPLWQNISYILLPTIQRVRLGVRRIRGLHRDYPAETFDSYPRPDLLLRQAPFRALLEKELQGGPLADGGVINPPVAQEMVRCHMEGRASYGDHLSALLSLHLWLSDAEG